MRTKDAVIVSAIIGAVVCVVLLFHFTDITALKESIRAFVDSFGVLAPLAYIFVFAITIPLLFPATVLNSVGTISFGPFHAFVYSLIGAIIGACIAFGIARRFGEVTVQRIIGKRAATYEKRIDDNAFLAMFSVRLLFTPLGVVSYAAGLTRMRFAPYFWGTLLGIIPGTFIFTFGVDALTSGHALSDVHIVLLILGCIAIALGAWALRRNH